MRRVFLLFAATLVAIEFVGLVFLQFPDGSPGESNISSAVAILVTAAYGATILVWLLASRTRIGSDSQWTSQEQQHFLLKLTLSDSVALIGVVVGILSSSAIPLAVSLVIGALGLVTLKVEGRSS
jgi:type VI protein secretion system component VasK